VFHLLGYDQKMTKFELTSELSNLSKVKNNLKKHWSNSNGWEMVKWKHLVVLSNVVWFWVYF
jgi:hypothetical protein